MIVFAILGLLIGLLFLFVRQKIGVLESRVNLLTDTVQAIAGFNRFEPVTDEDEDDEEEEEEDEEDEEDEDEDEEDVKGTGWITTETERKEIMIDDDVLKVIDPDVIQLDMNQILFENDPEVKTINLEKRVVSDDAVDFDSLSLKELKEKVTEAGGPKLRTKKELTDFLKNKI